MRVENIAELYQSAETGSRSALARLISLVERGEGVAGQAPASLEKRRGAATVIGMTGAPGAGKSTLTDKLIYALRAKDLNVAILAIDPSSPYSGGAILGDRVRMQEHALDSGVYIRSLATRGHLGGLSVAVPEAVRVLEMVGFPIVLVETVGVGQVEVEVAGAADTTIVVVNPGWGDSVQANKAGLMEIADIFVINKSDREGVRETRRDIEMMLDLGAHRTWRPPIVQTIAHSGEGVAELYAALELHREHLVSSGELQIRRALRLQSEFERHLLDLIRREVLGKRDSAELQRRVKDGELDPHKAAKEVFGGLMGL